MADEPQLKVVHRFKRAKKWAMSRAEWVLRRNLGKLALEKHQGGTRHEHDAAHIIGREQLLVGNPVAAAKAVQSFKNGSAFTVATAAGNPVACILIGEMGTGGGMFLNKLIAMGAFDNYAIVIPTKKDGANHEDQGQEVQHQDAGKEGCCQEDGSQETGKQEGEDRQGVEGFTAED